jgi:GDPmannose 4,6-dehydratase
MKKSSNIFSNSNISPKRALITGITGQDGSYLAELLLAKNYELHGVIRRSSSFNTERINHIYQDPHISGRRFFLHFGDLADSSVIHKLIYKIQPDEIYHLGAQSHVRVSFDIPEYTANVTGLGTMRILEAIRDFQENPPPGGSKKIKFYQASSSEMFGAAPPPQNEKTHFHPRSPYGCAKVFAYYATLHYREAHNIFACNGILFNHESERRGRTFVTKKITQGAARILAGLDKKLYLGNLHARRDWGYAPEFVNAMYLMMQHKEPDDYVIGTGQSHSVRDFTEAAFKYAGIDLEWKGEGKEEKGINKKTGEVLVEVDPYYYRPTEVENLIADASKAKRKLGWQPKTKFDELVKIMMERDLKEYGIKK